MHTTHSIRKASQGALRFAAITIGFISTQSIAQPESAECVRPETQPQCFQHQNGVRLLRWGSQDYRFPDFHQDATAKRIAAERDQLWIEFSGNEGTGSSERFAALLERNQAHARLVHVEPIAISHQQPYLIVSMRAKMANSGVCNGVSLKYEFDLLKYDHDPELRYHEETTACVALGNRRLAMTGRLGSIYAKLRNEKCMSGPGKGSEIITAPCSGLNEAFWGAVAEAPDLASYFPVASAPACPPIPVPNPSPPIGVPLFALMREHPDSSDPISGGVDSVGLAQGLDPYAGIVVRRIGPDQTPVPNAGR